MPATWTHLIRFKAVEKDGEHYGEPIDRDLDVGLAWSDPRKTILTRVWRMSSPWDEDASFTDEVLTVERLLPPVPVTDCIRAIGLNYKDHAAEMGLALPDCPSVFFKTPNTLSPPVSTVFIPPCAQRDEMDYEVELAIVISKRCKDVPADPDAAMQCVLGYTCANDLTARKVQDETSQWGYAKGFDGFLPLGPVLLSPRALPGPSVLRLQTHLNGELMQDGFASSMIFSIPQIIAHLSRGTTLEAGTVLITGTPSGIGNGRSPRVWLKDGDVVRCSISHGIGSCVNTIKYDDKGGP